MDGKTVGVVAAVVAGGILVAKGAKWAKPRVEEWWKETAHPKLTATKEKVVAKFRKNAGKRQGEDTSTPTAETIEEMKSANEKN